MWHKEFHDRLDAWHNLRIECETKTVPEALELVNLFWQETPWKSYYLHWDDFYQWPDPWQLLSENTYCELARALGICYTISMLDRKDLHDTTLIQTSDGFYLVAVQDKKYILNWGPETIVNTGPVVIKINKQYTLQEVAKKFK